jgi:hypothetical protein
MFISIFYWNEVWEWISGGGKLNTCKTIFYGGV